MKTSRHSAKFAVYLGLCLLLSGWLIYTFSDLNFSQPAQAAQDQEKERKEATIQDLANQLRVERIASQDREPLISFKRGPSTGAPDDFERLQAQAQAEGAVRVIVGLRVAFQPEGRLNQAAAQTQHRAIAGAQTALLARLSGARAASVKRFAYIPFLALEVDAAGLQQLRGDPAVTTIEEDAMQPATLAESVSLIGAPAAWTAGFSGTGQVVAILDTGVDKTHPFLSGKVVSEACYSTTGSGTTSVCPGGVSQSTSPGAGVNCSAPGCEHGTHVAGIAAGRSATTSGVARDANVIAIQVFSRINGCTNTVNCIGAFNSDILLGLQRVQALGGSFNIAAVNLSLGGGAFGENCDASQAAFKAAIDNLRSVNIATVVASGNDANPNGMGSPACISTAVSVGSTGDGSTANGIPAPVDVVVGSSNSVSFLNLLAPGQWINSSVPGGGFANFSGTSMAAPHVAGAWAVLKSKSPNASIPQVLAALASTGAPITDSRNGVIKPRIKLDAAATALSTSACSFSLSPTTQSFSPSGGVGTLNVTASAGCAWTAVSNDPWISVTAGGSGTGPGVVSYSVAANTSLPRNGTIFVAGQIFIVTQAGAPFFGVDDGSYEGAIGLTSGGTIYGVNRLTPTSYPATINAVAIYFPPGVGVNAGDPLAVLAGANPSGGSSISAASLQPTTATVQGVGKFNVYTIPGITINSGDFVVGMSFPHARNVLPLALDVTPPLRRRSYISTNGTTYTLIDDLSSSLASNFLMRALPTQAFTCPTVTSLNPTSGMIGSTVTITGTGFTGVNAVKFANNVTAQFTVVSDMQITATVPPGAASGPISISKPNCADVRTPNFAMTGPVIAGAGSEVTGENCRPPNGALDPGEMVIINFSLRNTGTVSTANLVATLQASGGVTTPGGPQTYGALTAGGAEVTRSFTFTVNPALTCGGSLTATLNLQDGTTNLGAIPFTFPLGAPKVAFSENFDGVTAPALPAGWTSTVASGSAPWVTSTTSSDSPPNNAFATDPSSTSDVRLDSPSIAITSPAAQLSFRNNYATESGFDGGVLEIAIGAGAFTDIITAGGSFITGGYNQSLRDGPIAGRQAWSGSSSGYITTTVNLPASAAGQNIKLRWRMTTDSSVSGTGWRIDTIRITDGLECATSCSGIPCPRITINPASLPAGALNAAYSQTITASGGVAPYNFTLSAGTLPNGLTLSPTGALSGTPTQGGNFDITVGATDANGCVGTRSYSLVINCPPITLAPATLPSNIVGDAYSQTITASGGAAPYSFSVTTGTLPGGLTLSSGGTLSGATNVAGTFTFTVTATDANNCTGARDYTVSVGPRIGQSGVLYVLNETPSGNQIYGYAVNETTGELTPLAGFPVSTGGVRNENTLGSERLATDRTNRRLYALNTGSNTVSAYAINPLTGALTPLPFSPINLGSGIWSTIAVHPSGSPLVVGDSASSATTPGRLASYQITATTAAAAAGSPYTTGSAQPFSAAFSQDGAYVYTGGNRNNTIAGFSVNAVAGTLTALTGSPFGSGANNPAAYATDEAGRLFIANFLAGQVRVFTATRGILTPVTGNPFTSGLTEAFHGLIHPNGFYLVADRGVFGSQPGNRVGVYQITGSGNATTLAAITGSPFASGGTFTNILALNRAGTFLFAANSNSRNLTTFGVNPTTGALTALGTQPANTLGALGPLTGMAYLPPSTQCPTIALSPATLPAGAVGAAYNQTLTASGGSAPYSFALSAGTLPNGLTLSSAGALSGTPTQSGSFPITVRATDASDSRCEGTQSYTLTINCQTITVNPETLPAGLVGTAYSQTFTQTGGAGNVTFSLSAGPLPAGLTLSPAGVLSGTTTQAGNFPITVRATDANGCTGTRSYTLVISSCPAVTLSPVTLPAATAGAAYNQTVSASPSGTYTFAVTAGSLPAGLTLNSTTGAITGAPTAAGAANFTITATGAGGCTGSQAYTINVQNPVPVISGLSPDSRVAGSAGFTLTVNGSGFVEGATVRWNDASRTTPFVNGGRLTATIPFTDIVNPGTANVTVVNPSPGGGASNVMTFNVTPPAAARAVRVVPATGSSGGNVVVPIELVSQGDENALGFSLTFDPAILGAPQAALGAGAAGATLNTNASQVAQGRFGVLLSLPTNRTFSEGARQIVNVTFTIANTQAASTNIGFGDQPVRREVANVNASPLPANYTPGPVAITSGYEADVAPRPDGDGAVTVIDWVLIGRLVAGLDTAANGSEFQRADCAPRDAKGDGRLTASDWAQAGRYAAGVDPLTTAGGATSPASAAILASMAAARAVKPGEPRLLRVVAGDHLFGATRTVVVELDAQGDESALGFSLIFNPSEWRFVSAEAGRDAREAVIHFNDNEAARGRIGLVLALPAGGSFSAGGRQLAALKFAPVAGAGAKPLAVGFADGPVTREVVNSEARALPARYEARSTSPNVGALANVSAASLLAGELAAGQIVTAFGENLAPGVQTTTSLPLPLELAGVRVIVTDSQGVERLAPLFFVSSAQINYLLPEEMAEGVATVKIINAEGVVSLGVIEVAAPAPSLFTANADGQGVAAAVTMRIRSDGAQSFEPVAQFDAAQGRFVASPIDLGQEGEVFLLLFGTGLRGRHVEDVTARIGGAKVEVLFAGPQGGLAGLDQINLRLPRSLAGRGEVDIALTVGAKPANIVRVRID